MDNNNKQNQNSNWQTITMLVIAALLTILIVGWMNSTVNARQRQELSYNEFVNMVENGKVESISVGSTIIEVKPKADDTNYSQQMKYYVVRLEGDYQFVDRILKNNVVTNRENNTSNALLLEILSYALPFLFLLFIMNFTMKRMGGGGAANLQQLARQAQKMQEQMEQITTELEAKEYTAAAGGGAVSATVTGKMEVKNIDIKPEVIDPDDAEMLGDLVAAAVNEALRAAANEKEEKLGAISGGMSLPGIL